MKKNKRQLLPILLGGLFLSASVYGQVTFSDDFSRENSADPGPDWTTSGGSWDVFSEQLRATSDNTNSRLARFDAVELADSFVITGDIRATSGARWGGLAFHVQDDPTSFFAIRVKHEDDAANGAVQFVRSTNGSLQALVNLPAGTIEAGVNIYYRHEIISTAPGEFQFNYYSLDSDRNIVDLLYSRTFTSTSFSGGFAGIHSAAHQILLDDFSVTLTSTTIDEEGTVILLY